MKIAMLGGSFDPVHNGHLSLAENVYTELAYEKIIFFPAFISPFKKNANSISAEHRLKMLLLATETNKHFMLDDFELRQKKVSYTIDTVRYCYKHYSIEGKLGLVIGADLLEDFYSWKDAKSLLEKCDLIVGLRPKKTEEKNGLSVKAYTKTAERLTAYEKPFDTPKAKLPPYISLENESLQISSSYIRVAIQQKKAWRYLVPESVYRYIEENSLYRSIK